MSEPAIEVADISKRFRVYRDKPTSLKQRVLSSRSKAEDFWALHEVSLVGAPYGAEGGAPGQSGRNTLIRDGVETTLPGKVRLTLGPCDRLRIESPGGGGYGTPE